MIDLHTHSTFSDGTLTPTELLAAADKVGLKAIALCDHNTIGGLPEFISASSDFAVEAIPGIEISTQYEGTELHIVGLYVDASYYARIDDVLAKAKERKERSNLDLVARLNQAGYDISYENVKRRAVGTINRANIAAELMEHGYINSIKEAMATLLSPAGELYTPPERLNTLYVLEMLRSIHAVAVLAHPLLNLTPEELQGFLPKAKEHGLTAMETDYTLYSEVEISRSRALAAQFGLLKSGGSDFHGGNKPDIALGFGKGALNVPDAYLEQIKQAKMNL